MPADAAAREEAPAEDPAAGAADQATGADDRAAEAADQEPPEAAERQRSPQSLISITKIILII